MNVYYHTFGCKANQYDTERMRQEIEARGGTTVADWNGADVCVVNTCTVTNRADADARRMVRRIRRRSPRTRVVVAGCSAALREDEYAAMDGVSGVVAGQDPLAVAGAVGAPFPRSGLVQLELRTSLDRVDSEPVGAEVLRERRGATRGWLKIQDGCDRRCSFCATRLARGESRSRPPDEIVAEARVLAEAHPELVLTGIHIGHYGRDLPAEARHRSLSGLLGHLLDSVPDVRFRLGSVEATEIDDLLVELVATSDGRVAPHLHMPLQSGADPVLRRMRRWHTREMYRTRALEIAERLPVLGLGADVITGFPGETDADHSRTLELVEELPFTYAHVFPFSPREGTVAAELARTAPVPERIAGERSREVREAVQDKGRRYRENRAGGRALVTLEREGRIALTGDYLRVDVPGGEPGLGGEGEPGVRQRIHVGVLRSGGRGLYIDLSHERRHDWM